MNPLYVKRRKILTKEQLLERNQKAEMILRKQRSFVAAAVSKRCFDCGTTETIRSGRYTVCSKCGLVL